MSVTQYVGARYVPLFANPIDWDITKTYEPLTIVYYQGNSYTSKQSVPTGTDINNGAYWALTGNYNAQIEQYRAEVAAAKNEVDSATATNTTQDAQIAGTTDSGLKQLISANTTSNTNQDAQLAGTTDSGLKQLISANTTSNTNQDAQLAGTTDSGLKQLISANTTSNTNQDKQLAGTTDSGLKQLISANTTSNTNQDHEIEDIKSTNLLNVSNQSSDIANVDSFTNTYIANKGSNTIYSRSSGPFERGATLGIITNSGTSVPVMGGTRDTNHTKSIASSYLHRDSVGIVSYNKLVPYLLHYSSDDVTYTSNTATINDLDISNIKVGMYVQTVSTVPSITDSNGNYGYLGCITGISDNILTVDNWYQIKTGTKGIPSSADLYINPLSSIWGANLAVTEDSDAEKGTQLYGLEINLNKKSSNSTAEGIVMVSNAGAIDNGITIRGINTDNNFINGMQFINADCAIYAYGAESIYNYLVKSFASASGADATNIPDFFIMANGTINKQRLFTKHSSTFDSNYALNFVLDKEIQIDLDGLWEEGIVYDIICGNGFVIKPASTDCITWPGTWGVAGKTVTVSISNSSGSGAGYAHIRLFGATNDGTSHLWVADLPPYVTLS